MMRRRLLMAFLMVAGLVIGSVSTHAYTYVGKEPEPVTISWDPNGAWKESKVFANDSSIFTVHSPSIGGQYTLGQEVSLAMTPHKYFNTVLPGGFSTNMADHFVMTILKGDTVLKTFKVYYFGEDLGNTFTDSFTPTQTGTYKVNIFYRGSTYSGENFGNYFFKVAAAGAKVGTTKKVSGQTYKVLTKTTVAFTKAANKKSVSVPGTVRINLKTYKVTQISKNAFKGSKIRTVTVNKNINKIAAKAFSGSKVTKVILKTKKLTKKSVKNSLKGSKVKTVQVKVNKTVLNKYKKIFVKKIVGRDVAVR